MLATAFVGSIVALTCRGADLEQEIRALRPHDTSAGERAVLDNLERRARVALANLKHARTPQEADGSRGSLRQQLERSLGLGLLPWPPNPQARTVGSIARGGYRIEKIVFQTLPGVLVPAHLYVPDGLRGRAPAVLFYVGHWWPDSKTRPDFQAFCINMARLGFVVLTWDPFGQGERGISSRDHRRTEALPAGVAQQGFAEYETRCAMEYLLSRPEVDPERVGMTGASGGGYNTWITSALDDRIKVAIPVVGTSDFYEQISVTRPLDWYHAAEHCHFIPGLIRYADNHEFIAMMAPKPLMIIAASKDQSFPIAGVRSVYKYGRDLYRAYGLAERIAFFEDTAEGHGYQKQKREAAYGWMLRWLKNEGDGAPFTEPETVTSAFDAAELRCFPPGENRAAGPGMIEAVRRLGAVSPRATAISLQEMMSWPSKAPPVIAAIWNMPVQRVTIASEEGLEVPAFLVRPKAVRGLLVAIDDRGKEELLSALPLRDVLAKGWAVLGIDPRGIGELKTSKMGWAAAVSLLLNENFVARQALDIARAIDAGGRTFSGKPVGLYARGDNAALAVTYALGQRSGIKFYVLQNGFISYRQFYDRPHSLPRSFELKKEDRDRNTGFDREIPFAYFPFAALRSFDLPDILARSRAQGLIAAPIDGDWNYLAEADARKIVPAGVKLATGTAADVTVHEFIRDKLN